MKDSSVERSKRYASRHREKVTAYHREWSRKNSERLKEYQKEWQKNNPEKVKEYRKRYLLKKSQNKEEGDSVVVT